MKRREKTDVALGLCGGIFLLIVTARLWQSGHVIMALLTSAAAVASFVLAGQDLARLRRR